MVKKFIAFENKYNLFELKIDNFELWSYIRFEMYYYIGKSYGLTNGVGSTPSPSFLDAGLMVKNTFITNPLFKLSKKDVLIIPHQRRILEDGKYRCIYTDSLAENLKYSNVSGEFLFGGIHYKPARTQDIIYLDCIDVIPAIKYKLFHVKNSEINKSIEIIRKSIHEYFEINVDRRELERIICKRFYYYKYKKPIVRSLIKKLSPKVIIELVGYEMNKMIVNEVAREMSIPCIELQHGVIGRGHIAYNFDTNNEIKQLPTHLFVYSKYWKDTCAFPIPERNIIVTGFPYMEEQMLKYPSKEKEVLSIIIYSSTDSTNEIKVFTEGLIEKMDEQSIDYRIIYKLHPLEYNYSKERWKNIINSPKVSFVDKPNKSLYELCSYSSVQIGVRTTAVFEGLSYGLNTFILDTGEPEVRAYMGDLVDNGYAVFGKTPDDFIRFILDIDNQINNIIPDNEFFVKDSLNNILTAIEGVV